MSELELRVCGNCAAFGLQFQHVQRMCKAIVGVTHWQCSWCRGIFKVEHRNGRRVEPRCCPQCRREVV